MQPVYLYFIICQKVQSTLRFQNTEIFWHFFFYLFRLDRVFKKRHNVQTFSISDLKKSKTFWYFSASFSRSPPSDVSNCLSSRPPSSQVLGVGGRACIRPIINTTEISLRLISALSSTKSIPLASPVQRALSKRFIV